MSETKTCSKCGETKTLDAFYRQKRGRLGRSSVCRTCAQARDACYSRARQSKRRPEQAAYRRKHPEKVKAWKAAYYQKHKEKLWAQKLLNAYGVSAAQYYAMLDAQNGRCAICARHQDAFAKRLFVDHCHQSGKIRGLLCKDCNIALGILGDSRSRVLQVARYLRLSRAAS